MSLVCILAGIKLQATYISCVRLFSLQGEGLRFPEISWSDANGILEDGHRRNLQRQTTQPASQRRALEGN